MSYKIRPALKSSPKHLIGLYSESGCGKTFPALLLAKGYAGDMSKVCMIETESGRGEMYAEHKMVGGYQVLPMSDNFSPSEYGKAIDVANHAGLTVLVVDSASHEWEGIGGVLSMAADNEASGKKGQLIWQKPKIDHQREFMLRLMQTPIPLVIVCMRAKYPMEQTIIKGEKGWQRSKELSPKQSDDILFEMLVHGWSDYDHNFHITKPRGNEDEVGILPVFPDGKPITVETGKRLAEWAAGGIKQSPPTKEEKESIAPSSPSTLTAIPITAEQKATIKALMIAKGMDDETDRRAFWKYVIGKKNDSILATKFIDNFEEYYLAYGKMVDAQIEPVNDISEWGDDIK